MPVVEKKKVVGIITESDILRAFIDMMGLLTASSRIDVLISALLIMVGALNTVPSLSLTPTAFRFSTRILSTPAFNIT